MGHDESPEDGHSFLLVEVSREALYYVELACSLKTQFLYLFVEIQNSVEVYSKEFHTLISRDDRVADSERCSRVAWLFQNYRLKFAWVGCIMLASNHFMAVVVSAMSVSITCCFESQQANIVLSSA